jgi:hypothetical protein
MINIFNIKGTLSMCFRDSQRERTMLTTVREDLLGVSNRNYKHLLVLQDLEQYNKVKTC